MRIILGLVYISLGTGLSPTSNPVPLGKPESDHPLLVTSPYSWLLWPSQPDARPLLTSSGLRSQTLSLHQPVFSAGFLPVC